MPPAISTNQQRYPVTISFSSPGARPPVFVAGDLTQPPWIPTEMHAEPANDGEVVFKSVFHLPAGSYQYKFRLGQGDWWLCDESADRVDTAEGITNNRLVVSDTGKSPNPNNIVDDISQNFASFQGTEHAAHNSSGTGTVVPVSIKLGDSGSNSGIPAKMDMHLDVKPTLQQVETLKAKFVERSGDPYAGVGDGDDTPLEDPGAPLLPHEIGAHPPTPPEEGTAALAELSPVLSSATSQGNRRDSENLRKSRSNSIVPLSPTNEDLNNPNIEHFPADRQNILKRIQTLKHQLPEDETRELETAMSSEDDISEADVRDSFTETMQEPSAEAKELDSSTRTTVNAATKSFEHLEPVPEYDETDSTITLEAGTESTGAENHQQKTNDSHSDRNTHRSYSRFAGSDGAFDEHTWADMHPSESQSPSRKTPTYDPIGQGDESEDDFDDACSESPLLAIKEVSLIERVWSQICTALGQFWRFMVESFSKSKRE